jgi:glucose uptake protein
VAFPVGIGIALVLGVLLNYMDKQEGDPILLFAGVALVACAIVLDAMAYRKLPGQKQGGMKGLVLSVGCGVLMSLFYYLVMQSLAGVELEGGKVAAVNATNLAAGTLQAGQLTAYSANVIFCLGILLSNFVINTAIMIRPIEGEPVSIFAYFKGGFQDHLWGVVGGCIWAVGMSLNIVAAGVAGPAIAYGLGQGATMIAAIWGVFIWREFRQAPAGTNKLLFFMFASFLIGLALVVMAKIPACAILN